MEGYSQTLLVKPEMFVYQIPPRQSNRGYRGSDWNLSSPDYTVRLRIIGQGKKCVIKMEDKSTGEPFAECPIEEFPGPAVEPVTDSSRYFVLRVQDGSGRHAYLGVGFGDRADSFDFNVALQDFFKREKVEREVATAPAPALDLTLKEGQRIHINIGGSGAKARPKPATGGSVGILPPPPGGSGRVSPQPPQLAAGGAAMTTPASSGFGDDAWGNFQSGAGGAPAVAAPASDPFGSSSSGGSGGGWVQF